MQQVVRISPDGLFRIHIAHGPEIRCHFAAAPVYADGFSRMSAGNEILWKAQKFR